MLVSKVPEVIGTIMSAGLPGSLRMRGTIGIGKSSACVQAAIDLSRSRFVNQPFGLGIRMLTTMDAPDLRGHPVPQRDEVSKQLVVNWTFPDCLPGGPRWRKLNATDRVYFNGERLTTEQWTAYQVQNQVSHTPAVGILFLDEDDKYEQDITKAASELFLNGTIGDYSLEEYGNWMVVLAGNLADDRSGSVQAMSYITNRSCSIDVEVDPRWTMDYWARTKLPPWAIAFAKERHDLVFYAQLPENTNDPWTSPRSYESGVRWGDAFLQAGDKELAAGAMAGWMGQGTTREALIFAELGEQLPDFNKVVESPTTIAIPEEMSALLVLAYVYASKVNDSNIDPVMKFVTRLPRDLQLAFVLHVIATQPTLVDTKSIGAWQAKNSEAVIRAQSH